ncbi:hypothetical protein [Methylohalobius crimeensis]|uniref:hypothetical protein n=1 Tax=Methylohalobius crimeensis TaxID=244365 RepID=UPI0003B633FD|nr:hypothetical protein [Methylohalobius crimeensis]
MNTAQAIQKMKNAGFDLAIIDGRVMVSPVSKLTDDQRAYLQAHKREIIAELESANSGPDESLPWRIRWTLETWLDAIEEHDPADRALVCHQAATDAGALDRWLRCAAEYGMRPEQAPPDPNTAISLCPTCGRTDTGAHQCGAPASIPGRERFCDHFKPKCERHEREKA